MCLDDEELEVAYLTEDPDYGWDFYTDGSVS